MRLPSSALRATSHRRLAPQRAMGCAVLAAALILVLNLWHAERARAAEPCAPAIARLVSVQGTVDVRRAGTEPWQPARLDDPLCVGDTVRVGATSRAALAFVNDSVLSLDALTTLRLRGLEEERRTLLDLLAGAVQFFSHRPRALEIGTPFVNAAAEGTEFVVRVAEDRAEVVMLAGLVRLTNPQGELLLAAGDAAIVPAGQAPEPQIVARPRDAVAWALFYPPVLTPLATGEAAGLPPGLTTAVARVAANDHPGALAALDEEPDAVRDARYHTYRAGILLNVGQVAAAQAAIEQALALDPAAGDALAQRAIIALVQNRRAEALADARRAVELAPDSAAAAIALSYALQGDFQLEAARDVLRDAVERHPEDALVWARLSELEQSFGELGRAREAAERAVALAPSLARTQMVLGFAALTRIDIGAAKAAFERSIALDSANPLPRLGLGLAMIRESGLEAGRGEIEIAAALDPNDSLIRSYLGKAFFEERRDGQAGEQFAIAKQLDPNDPTPWLYDAIRLQLANRPVEALHSLEKSIELNDNRAPYRSRLLLDEDTAVRQTSLARIYDDLGFEQLGLLEATRSLSIDPASHSAHRFLSDTYARLPRHEIARASELLQSQLLQPININPVQPSAPITDLNVVAGAGPADAAFNEFTPLFARDNAQLTTTGFVGNHDTFGGESVLSMLYGRTSLSVGGFFSDTDGFRDNNDVKNQLANAYAQVAVTPKLNLQAEYRYRDTEQGDLRLNFDPDDFSSDDRRDLTQRTARMGLRYSPSVQSDVLVSVFHSNRDEDQLDFDDILTPDGIILSEDAISTEDDGWQAETQYVFRAPRFNVQTGLSAYNIDVNERVGQTFTLPDGPIFELPESEVDFSREQLTAYAYSDIKMPWDVTWTVGLGYDTYEEQEVDVDKLSPKIGVQWQIIDALRLRAAAMRTVKRALVVNQTLEPTQVAGFNQFFDDLNGTTADRYAIGLDFHPLSNVYTGLEYSFRDLDVAEKTIVDGTPGNINSSWDERLYRAYAYWAPADQWALTAEVRYEEFDSAGTNDVDVPNNVKTLMVPLSVRYFSPVGVFAELGATFVHQDVERRSGSTLPEGDDSFALVDVAVGYRIPRRLGLISLEARNLLDNGFKFQDDNYRTNEVRQPLFFPERTVLGRLTLTF